MENSAPIDYISTLPDEILCHILSFLPTKLAFSTTILSKRWAPLYKSLTSLYFDDESKLSNEEAFHRFCCFVDAAMHSTKLIKTFHLTCCSTIWQQGRNRSIVKGWINIVKLHPLENLLLSGGFYVIRLQPNFFNFPTLVNLNLIECRVAGNIYVNLPSLKILHISQAEFKNKQNLNKFLYGCPILEDFTVIDIDYVEEVEEDVMVSTREFKTLSKLIKAEIDETDVYFGAICNVHVLKIGILGKIPEPEIKSYFRDFLGFHNLTHLELIFCIFRNWNNALDVLQNCPKLQILSIEKPAQRCNNDLLRNWKYSNSVPMCISSHLRSCTINYVDYLDEVRFAEYILENAPLLDVMKITICDAALSIQDALEELTSCPRISPKCKLSISFNYF